MEKIDVFAHVLLPNFYQQMLKIEPLLPEKIPFINNQVLVDMEERRKTKIDGVKQIISYVNVNPEDYVDSELSYSLCKMANEELITTIRENKDLFYGGVAMIPMNNIEGAIEIMEHQVMGNEELFGIQLFTRANGKSIADESFKIIFEKASELNIPIWLHPVFDTRKPDNNIVFSWEYELSLSMMQLVESGIMKEFPNLKIIVHHAGAMVPFFQERVHYILGEEKQNDFKKFYVDTALLGNTKALELAFNYYGSSHILFGTDAPLGIPPAGATKEIMESINKMNITEEEKENILTNNIITLLGQSKGGERNG